MEGAGGDPKIPLEECGEEVKDDPKGIDGKAFGGLLATPVAIRELLKGYRVDRVSS